LGSPDGTPISAIFFGGRRSTAIPLVSKSFNWSSGVYLGATMDSETTAAAAGATGKVRLDTMAMLSLAAITWGTTCDTGSRCNASSPLTLVYFTLTWFRKDQNGKFLWPGFSENMRVLPNFMATAISPSQLTSSPL
jgi:phosphoenolpyruvate carboxykinase (GTP)